MQTLRLTEAGSSVRIALPPGVAEALAASGVATITPVLGSSELDVAAARQIGVARVGDLQVVVSPKVPIDRLIFMLGYTRDPGYWQDRTVLVDIEKDLPEALAETFGRVATRSLEQGLLHGYVAIDDALPVVRGRIRVGDQITRRFGRALPLEVRYDEFTSDIAENQILLAAVLRLLRLPTAPSARRTLIRLRQQLADVTPIVGRSQLPAWRPSRLNARYQPALRLAEVIVSGNSFEQRVGDLSVSGFMFDMWRIYEDFVCTALKEALLPFGGRSYLQFRTHLDQARAVKMRPDFVWSYEGLPRLVVDAKYKAERYDGFPQADLYQLLAYCTVLGLPEGHLVYARGAEQPATHDVVGTGVRIHAHSLDLEQPPSGLLLQIQGLTTSMRPAVVTA